MATKDRAAMQFIVGGAATALAAMWLFFFLVYNLEPERQWWSMPLVGTVLIAGGLGVIAMCAGFDGLFEKDDAWRPAVKLKPVVKPKQADSREEGR